MPKALEIIGGYATAPSTTATGLTMFTGNSLTIRNAPLDSVVKLLQAWVDVQGAGYFRIRSPRLHDNVQGIRLYTVVSEVQPLLPMFSGQKLIAQDTLVAEITGSATAGDLESACMLLYYDNLPGVDARLASVEDVLRRLVNIVTVENTLSLGTGGGWSGEEALNAELDLLKANTDYALLGYLVSAECAAVRWRGVDTGNLGVGGPGTETNKELTAEWFVRLSRQFGLPLIPVFNSANKAGILVDGAQDENGTDVTLTSILGEIGPTPR